MYAVGFPSPVLNRGGASDFNGNGSPLQGVPGQSAVQLVFNFQPYLILFVCLCLYLRLITFL